MLGATGAGDCDELLFKSPGLGLAFFSIPGGCAGLRVRIARRRINYIMDTRFTQGKNWVGVVLLGIGLSGCMAHRTNLAPAPLRGGAAVPVEARPQGNAQAWWQEWESEELDGLIRRALADNLDVAAAEARVEQARALYRGASAALGPRINGTLGAEREVGAQGRGAREEQLSARAALTLPVDVGGRRRATRQARAAEVWAREETLAAFRLELSAEVAEVYLGIVEQRLLLGVLGDQLQTAREFARIIQQRFDEGLVSRLDVLQQQTRVAELESQVPATSAGLEELFQVLAALVGALPDEELKAVGAEAKALPLVTMAAGELRGVDLLEARPDLRAARAALVAADAETGRALAERLPSLDLAADASWVKSEGVSTSALAVGVDLLQPLLDWGARRAEWVRTRAVYEERLAAFSQAYLRAVRQVAALREVEIKQRELLEVLGRRRELLETTMRQARNRYEAGLTDYLPVLTATEQLHAVEQRQVRELRRQASMRVALRRATGGLVPPLEKEADRKAPPVL